jgi:sigma-B regulation protein RsbU (phosphoserine phosphatase)
MTLTPPPAADDNPAQSELEFITELCSVVAEQAELQPILDWLVRKTTRLLGTEECSIKLVSAGSEVARTIMFDNRRTGFEAGNSTWSPLVKTLVMGFLMSQPGELASADLESDPRFPALRGQATPIRAVLALPLKVDGRVTGMIAVSNAEPGRQWTRQDVQLMSIVASHSASVVEKTRLRAEAEGKRRLELEKQAMEKELLLAREIQMRLIPAGPMVLGQWLVEGRLIPAKQVGGDFFDYFPIDDGRAALVIADVAGKGIPAALLVSTVQSAVRAFADGQLSPKALVELVNRAAVRSAAAGKFVTLFYAEFDHAHGRLRYVNAGHNYPRLRGADGTLQLLVAGGVPLGLFEHASYEQAEVSMGPGDSLLLFSDGISEAMDSFQQEYGEDRLDELWRECGQGAAAASIERVMSDVLLFRGAAAQSDDMTTVVVAPAAS